MRRRQAASEPVPDPAPARPSEPTPIEDEDLLLDEDEDEGVDPAERTMITSAAGLDLDEPPPRRPSARASTELGERTPLPRSGTEASPPIEFRSGEATVAYEDAPERAPRLGRAEAEDPFSEPNPTWAADPAEAGFGADDDGYPLLSARDAPPLSGLHSVDPEVEAHLLARIESLEAALADAERARDAARAAETAAIEQARQSAVPAPVEGAGSRELLELKKERNARDREILELRRQLHEHEAERLAWQDQEAERDGETVELREGLERAQRDVAAARAESAALEARLGQLERTASEQSQALKKRIGALTVREAELEGALQKQSVEMRTLKAEIESAGRRAEERARAHEEAKALAAQLDKRLAAQQDEVIRLTDELTNAVARTAGMEEALEAKTAALESTEEERQRLSREAFNLQQQAEASRRQLDKLQAALTVAEATIEGHEKARARASQALEVYLGILREAGLLEP